jgi:hypothetical protein
LKIKNISTKPQGRKGAPQRETGTHLSDPKGLFNLKRADSATPHDIMDMIDLLEPGETTAVAIEFQVSEAVEELTTGSMLVGLLLADPHTEKLRSVVSFDLRIQISPSYRYNPLARFLLVINASASNDFVQQIIHFIQAGLHLDVDLFNLSLNGSFTTPDTHQDVLPKYSGKTIILLGNTMNYFQDGTREPWELMDMGQAFNLAKDGTTFMVIAPSNTASLGGFAHMLAIPGAVLEDTAPENAASIKDMLSKFATSPALARTSPTIPILVPVKKQILQNLDKSISAAAKSVQHKLTDSFPLRRFLVSPYRVGMGESTAKHGALGIVEGLPVGTKLVASLQPFQVGPHQGLPVLSEYNMAMLSHCLPFADECAMFWNLVGVDTTFGVDAEVVYAGDRCAHLCRHEAADGSQDRRVSGKVNSEKFMVLLITAC